MRTVSHAVHAAPRAPKSGYIPLVRHAPILDDLLVRAFEDDQNIPDHHYRLRDSRLENGETKPCDVVHLVVEELAYQSS